MLLSFVGVDGGGSTLDTAKAAAILLSHPGPIKNYILAQPIQVNVDVPIILLPTTAGTGSECTKVAVKYLPLKGTFLYSQITDPAYSSLVPCDKCNPPNRPN